MKKIIASILAAFFVVLSPISAYAAASTESMMMFSTGAGFDEYAVMPLAYPNTFDLTLYSGVYNAYDESFDFVSRTFTGLSNGSPIVSADWQNTRYTINYSLGDKPVFGFSIGSKSQSSSISVPDGALLSVNMNNLFFDIRNMSNTVGTPAYPWYALLVEKNVPFKVYADMYFTATQQYGNTHSPTYHEQTVEVTNFLTSAQNPTSGNQLFYFDVNSQIPISADTSGFTGDKLYNINLRYIKVYAVYDFSQFGYPAFDSFMPYIQVGTSIPCAFYTRNLGSESLYTSRISVNYSGGNVDSGSLSTNIIQSSISSLGSTLSNSMSQVKTQVTQSTNTITTRIQTMETNVVDGLSNVVESAKQNTQNIINTVTQKVDQVKETVTEVKDSILDLPNKIQEMLLGLIVPDSDTMADKYSEFSALLEEKLGVIYQIPMMLFDFFDTIVNAATTPQSTLTLPAFRLPWIDGSQLTIWNSMEYKIIPDGLEVLSDLIRTVTSMTVVVLTFNSVKQAYERFLRS